MNQQKRLKSQFSIFLSDFQDKNPRKVRTLTLMHLVNVITSKAPRNPEIINVIRL